VRLRLLFAAAVVAATWAAAETVAWAGFWYLDGTPFGPARLAAEQRAVAAERPSVVRPGLERKLDPAAAQMLSRQVVHPYLGFVYDPETSHASEWGFLDEAPPFHHRAPDQLIVAVTGGSLALQLVDHRGAQLAERLAALPRFAGRAVVLVNLAVEGFKEPQQLATLSYLLALGAEFDLLLNLDGFNEIALHGAENERKGVFPAFPRSWYLRSQSLPDPETHALIGEIYFLEQERMRGAAWMLETPFHVSPLADLVWRMRDRRLVARIADVQAQARERSESAHDYQSTGPSGVGWESGDTMADLARIWAESSVQLHRLARANDIAYYHFLQPNQYLPDSKPMGDEERRVAIQPDHPYAGAARSGYPKLQALVPRLRGAGVRFEDLTGLFAAVPEPIYKDVCCHVNDRGNEILVDAMVAYVATNPE
jgi:hypothetical protein